MTDELQDYFSSTTKEAVREERAKGWSRTNILKWKDGNTVVRILPAAPGRNCPWIVTYSHFFKNYAGGNKPLVFNCPKKMAKQPCPACERAELYAKSGDPVQMKLAKDYEPNLQCYANAIDRQNEGAGVQVVRFGATLLGAFSEFMEDEEVYGRDFTHPIEGRDIIVKRSVERGKIKYQAFLSNKGDSQLHESDQQMIDWLKGAPELAEFAKVLPYKAIKEKSEELQKLARGEDPKTDAPALPAATVDAEPVDSMEAMGKVRTAEDVMSTGEGLDEDLPF